MIRRLIFSLIYRVSGTLWGVRSPIRRAHISVVCHV
jgi:hypothetical protein